MEATKPSYYQINKERVLKHMTRKVHCESCNCMVSFCNLPRHNRSPKHLGTMKEKMSDDERELLKSFDKYVKLHRQTLKDTIVE